MASEGTNLWGGLHVALILFKEKNVNVRVVVSI